MTTNALPTASLEEILAAIPTLVEEIGDGAAERELEGHLPYESVEAVRASGLTALRVPRRYGGPEGSLRQLFDAVIAISEADSNVGQGLRSHFGFVESTLARGTEAEHERWFAEIVAGRVFGLAEAERGINDPTKWRTRLHRDETGRRFLNGTKYYSTGSLFADWIEVVAVSDEGVLTTLLVPRDREGVNVVNDFDSMGQRGTASGTTIFTDVLVHDEEILDRPDFTAEGRPFNYQGGFYQLYLGAVSAGIAKNVFSDAARYAREGARVPTHSVADRASADPYVLETVGEIGALAFGAVAAIRQAAEHLDEAALAPEGSAVVVEAAVDVAKAQLVAARAAIQAGQLIFETGGGSATSAKLNFSRHWRNARTIANHNPLAYKARATGDFAVNGATPPNNGYF